MQNSDSAVLGIYQDLVMNLCLKVSTFLKGLKGTFQLFNNKSILACAFSIFKVLDKHFLKNKFHSQLQM